MEGAQTDHPVGKRWVGGEVVVAASSPGVWTRYLQKASVERPKRKRCGRRPQKMKQQPKIRIVAAESLAQTSEVWWEVEGNVGVCPK